MNVQLIFCIETNKQADTDFIYINEVIKEFYQLDPHIKISPVYMNGRGNFNTHNTESKVSKLKKEYAAANSESATYVLYCLDCDRYDSNPEDRAFLISVKQYCDDDEDRQFVWFCRDVEDVFLGKQVEKKQKHSEAVRFQTSKKIKSLNTALLSVSGFRQHYSNLCLVLDEFLTRNDRRI